MTFAVKLRYLRIAPRKVRLVADLIRGKTVGESQAILKFIVKKSAHPLTKLLNSAVANARHNFQIESENLYISKITVDEGPKYKRWMPRARGSASEIQKKTSHVTLVLDEIKGFPKKAKMKKTKEKKEPAVLKKELPSEKEKKITTPEKPKFRPELEKPKPKIVRSLRKIFRRKSI